MSSYKGKDDCTDTILDMISERESAGNYNAVIGKVHATDELSKLNINQIYDLMKLRLADGMPSTAIGRYQIIRKTMMVLQAKLGFKGTDLFTHEMQDRLAVELLKGRGYMQWWDDRMSDEDFAHGLSCEWASLPDPQNGGRSHYDGVAGNHAGMSLQHVYAGLQKAKSLKK